MHHSESREKNTTVEVPACSENEDKKTGARDKRSSGLFYLFWLFVIGMLVWDFFPYIQWWFVRSKIRSTVGTTWVESELMFHRSGLKATLYTFAADRVVAVTPQRRSILAKSIITMAAPIDNGRLLAPMANMLFPSAVIEIDSSGTLTRINYMF